jgi:metal-responsive CopG/Arc/MetJ family transcriptional regulator
MKQKMSITLSDDLVATIDRMAGPGDSRSSFIEKILRDFVDSRARAKRNAREVAAINRHAAKLNAEMMDALACQSAVDE